MKFPWLLWLHLPGLLLIFLCAEICALVGWDSADQWLQDRFEELRTRCQ